MNDVQASDPLRSPAEFMLMVRGLTRAKRTAMVPGLIAQARARYSGDPLWEQTIRHVVAHLIPGFHAPMLHDTARNTVYREALINLAPGKAVLDIGTGSGLLAMMAVRAGAAHVYACEANVILAAAAKDAIAANGMSEQITVFAQHFTDLDRERDLKGGVDLVVSEILADDLLGEAMLPSLEHARNALCLPDAVFVPGRVWAQTALANYSGFTDESSAEVEGFDLSAHTSLLSRRTSVKANHSELQLLSSPATAFAFDFGMDKPHAATDSRQVTVTAHAGEANAIAQWIGFECASGHAYENAPGTAEGMHWRVQLTPIAPLRLEQGQAVTIEAHRDQLGMVLELTQQS